MKKNVKIVILCISLIMITSLLPFVIFSIYDYHVMDRRFPVDRIDNRIDSDIKDIYLLQSLYTFFNTNSLIIFEEQTYIQNDDEYINTITPLTEEYSTILDTALDLLLLPPLDYHEIDDLHVFSYKESVRDGIIFTHIHYRMENQRYRAIVEQHTGKIIYLEIDPLTNNINDIQYFLEMYITYLGLDIIDDWAYDHCILVSNKAQIQVEVSFHNKKMILEISPLWN